MSKLQKSLLLGFLGVGATIVIVFAVIFATTINRPSSPLALPSTATPTTPPTAAPSPTPAIDLLAAAKSCGWTPNGDSRDPTNGPYTNIGDLLFSATRLGFLTYPGLKLPDGILQGIPYHQATLTYTQRPTNTDIQANPGIESPGYGGSSYELIVCNISKTQSHVLQSPGVQIHSFTPDTSDNINVESGPCDASFSTTRGAQGGGCGGYFAGSDEGFSVTWPTTIAVGTLGSIKETQSEKDHPISDPTAPIPTTPLFGPFPVTLQPSQLITLYFGMTYPNQPGTYSFSFGMQVDSATMRFPGSTTTPVFLAKNAHKWSGSACQSAQLPKSASEQFYLCPVAG